MKDKATAELRITSCEWLSEDCYITKAAGNILRSNNTSAGRVSIHVTTGSNTAIPFPGKKIKLTIECL